MFMFMFLLIAFVITSIVLYIYNKVMITRTEHPVTQQYYNSIAKFFLGIFIVSFGAAQYLYYETRLSLFIGILFIVLGVLQLMHGWRAARHYKNEYKRVEKV